MNKPKRTLTPEQKARARERERGYRQARNIRYRERYQSDPEFREKARQKSKAGKPRELATRKAKRAPRITPCVEQRIHRAILDEYQAESSAIAKSDRWHSHPEAKRWASCQSARRQYQKIRHDSKRLLPIRLRSRLYKFIKGHTSCSIRNVLGCTREQLTAHLESLFQLGMTWDNYGRNGWHIDHVQPCSAFDLRKMDQRRACFHFTNLRPMWEAENISKGKKQVTHQPELLLAYT